MSLKIKFAFKNLNIYVCTMQTEIQTPPKPAFVSVKQYADQKGTTVQAVYGKINRNTVEVKKIGNLILVRDI